MRNYESRSSEHDFARSKKKNVNGSDANRKASIWVIKVNFLLLLLKSRPTFRFLHSIEIIVKFSNNDRPFSQLTRRAYVPQQTDFIQNLRHVVVKNS